MQGPAGPTQPIEFREIDEKTLQCLKCLSKFHKVLRSAHIFYHTKPSDKASDLKTLKNPSIILNIPQPSQLHQTESNLPQKRAKSSSVQNLMSDFRVFSTATNHLIQIRERCNFILILHYFRKLKKIHITNNQSS